MPDPVLIYGGLLILALIIYFALGYRRHLKNRSARETALSSGLGEPASLHPVFDEAVCIGCAACITACPEGNVIGLIDHKAALINPSHCIGNGACQRACPVGAIELVFGTEKRGVDIPMVKPNFETNVPGLFIAGELGGMGLIRNAIEQGRQAMDAIRKAPGIGRGDGLDVVIIGAGPAGIAATLAAKQHNLRYRTIEQDSLGGTVAHFPRGKIVMTQPVDIPLVGKVKVRETTKEALLELWQGIIEKTGIEIAFHERMETIEADGTGRYTVVTNRGRYTTATVLLAIGRRGTPRKLGVPGEELDKVVYRLIDPEQYRGQKVLVVGGGDSALEAATTIAEQPGTEVTLSYRSAAFSRAKEKNRQRVDAMRQAGRLAVELSSQVVEILPEAVRLSCADGEEKTLANDGVIVCAGGLLPTPMLREIGIEVETKYGTA